MKIQLASDLHLEFLQPKWPGERIITPHPDADVLVLAGDIANGTQVARLFSTWPVPVLYVAGNHEYYDHSLPGTQAKLRETCKVPIQFLENDMVTIGNVRFLGCTLWTNYRLIEGELQSQMMREASQCLNDHNSIRVGRLPFTPSNALAIHDASIRWLLSELDKPWEGQTVVITHHGPHPLSVHPRYIGQLLNAAFCSNLDVHFGLFDKVDLWVHGHVHDGFDYVVPNSKCRVVANPAGYVLNRRDRRPGGDWEFENKEWQRDCLLEL